MKWWEHFKRELDLSRIQNQEETLRHILHHTRRIDYFLEQQYRQSLSRLSIEVRFGAPIPKHHHHKGE